MDKNYRVNGSYTYASPLLTTEACWMAWCRLVINRNRRTVNLCWHGCLGMAHRRCHSTLYGYSWMLPKLSRRLGWRDVEEHIIDTNRCTDGRGTYMRRVHSTAQVPLIPRTENYQELRWVKVRFGPQDEAPSAGIRVVDMRWGGRQPSHVPYTTAFWWCSWCWSGRRGGQH
jgi:hypothetical protein